jgi:hypothetical protein
MFTKNRDMEDYIQGVEEKNISKSFLSATKVEVKSE